MPNSQFELDQLFYHSNHDNEKALAHQADEMMIANMLTALNNPVIYQSLTDEEKNDIITCVKNHVALSARMTLSIQQERMNSIERGQSFI